MKTSLFEVNPVEVAAEVADEIRRLGLEDKMRGLDLASPQRHPWEEILTEILAGKSKAFQWRYVVTGRAIDAGERSVEGLLWNQVFIWALYHELQMDEDCPL
jgi:hypothetical protein